MHLFDRPIGPQGRPLIFPFAGWIMLAVIMIFAAAAGGQVQPQLRLNGSAFDPSTTAVALNPKQRSPAAKAAVLQNDLPDALTGSAPVADGAAVLAASPIWQTLPIASAPLALYAVPGQLRRPASPLGARAPPLP